MSSNEVTAPEGLSEHTPKWHLQKLIEFTDFKRQIGEPSPHLALLGHMTRRWPLQRKAWALGCYASVYCLPTAQVLWDRYPTASFMLGNTADSVEHWIHKHWKGIVTRTERRCVRSAPKLMRCLMGYAKWVEEDFPRLSELPSDNSRQFYDGVWESVLSVPFIGRYIGIRVIEGLRRYCGVPAQLYDMRSIGGWSPKKAMVYLYPQHQELLLTDNAEGSALADKLVAKLLERMQKQLPWLDYYVLAAMLCEYREAFERRHQYVGWTISQEPELFRKVKAYWGDDLNDKDFWKARAALFPHEALEEFNDWQGIRWPLTKLLRDHGYNWIDTKYDYVETLRNNSWATPVARHHT